MGYIFDAMNRAGDEPNPRRPQDQLRRTGRPGSPPPTPSEPTEADEGLDQESSASPEVAYVPPTADATPRLSAAPLIPQPADHDLHADADADDEDAEIPADLPGIRENAIAAPTPVCDPTPSTPEVPSVSVVQKTPEIRPALDIFDPPQIQAAPPAPQAVTPLESEPDAPANSSDLSTPASRPRSILSGSFFSAFSARRAAQVANHAHAQTPSEQAESDSHSDSDTNSNFDEVAQVAAPVVPAFDAATRQPDDADDRSTPDGDELDLTHANLQNLPRRDGYGVLRLQPQNVDDRLIALCEPTAFVAEEYRSIRTTLLARWEQRRNLIHTITSATPKEGKTITSLNLGASFAELRNRRTIVVEADLRLPQFQNLMDLPDGPGLVDVLEGEATLDDAIRIIDGVNLAVLAAGRRADINAVQLLSSRQMAKTFDALRQRFDHVVVDTPPVVELADAGILGAMSDDVMLIVRMQVTPQGLVEQAVRTLKSYNAPVAGVIATDQARNRSGAYYSRYGYHYYGGYRSYRSYRNYRAKAA
jgi:capsular exopolysaccharide synthesis family protein